ncbi:gamma carbonic anhydrase family protein [Bacillus sp. V3B]|uniref:gamma carbonic anhydrase family protein n=1 Tax=Bacillus sp. V3B TaxID=2804915 RepID=UPI00210D04C8|nr:gamma carbonic anhydrase family protein [Bacillus sp. V3B]MCQ6275355.1 gamma carbonic anhydrase family protein [Bacillus sp. V3B]
MGIYSLDGITPKIHPSAYIAPGAQIIGDVEIKENATIWFNAVLRGDVEKITIGEGANVQDGTVIHTDTGCPTTIKKNATIGHNCVIHGCIIEEDAMIGMNATVLSRAHIKKQAFVSAGALVGEGKIIEERMLAVGVPAKPIKVLQDDLINRMKLGAEFYQNNAKRFRNNDILE